MRYGSLIHMLQGVTEWQAKMLRKFNPSSLVVEFCLRCRAELTNQKLWNRSYASQPEGLKLKLLWDCECFHHCLHQTSHHFIFLWSILYSKASSKWVLSLTHFRGLTWKQLAAQGGLSLTPRKIIPPHYNTGCPEDLAGNPLYFYIGDWYSTCWTSVSVDLFLCMEVQDWG